MWSFELQGERGGGSEQRKITMKSRHRILKQTAPHRMVPRSHRMILVPHRIKIDLVHKSDELILMRSIGLTVFIQYYFTGMPTLEEYR